MVKDSWHDFLHVFSQYILERDHCYTGNPPDYLKLFKTRYFKEVAVGLAVAQFKCNKALNQRLILDLALNQNQI